jgi:hypothetical protein
VAESPIYRWRKKFGGLSVAEIRRLEQFEVQTDWLRDRVLLWCLKTPSAALEFAQSGFALSSATDIRTDVFFLPHNAWEAA